VLVFRRRKWTQALQTRSPNCALFSRPQLLDMWQRLYRRVSSADAEKIRETAEG
jgi:hypothetical protein